MVVLGVQLAHLLTVVLVAACVLLGLVAIALAALARHGASSRQVLQPVLARRIVRRAAGRYSSDGLALPPARDPPDFPPPRTPQDDADRFFR